MDAPNIVVGNCTNPISQETEMIYGSKPADGGHLFLSEVERDALLAAEPLARQYIRPFFGADEFINGKARYCLWFASVSEIRLNHDLKHMPQVAERIEAVRQMRQVSPKVPTQKQAATPHLLSEIRQPESGHYLIIPSVSSETRRFVPIDYVKDEVVNGNANFSLPNAKLYHFGILCSTMHNAFMRTVAGRLKSDYRYSNKLVYNNFPFPFTRSQREAAEGGVAKHIVAIEQAAQSVLDARAFYVAEAEKEGLPIPTLADFYAANAPFTRLHQAHAVLDKAVDSAYGYKGGKDDASRVAFLFGLYQQLAVPVVAQTDSARAASGARRSRKA